MKVFKVRRNYFLYILILGVFLFAGCFSSDDSNQTAVVLTPPTVTTTGSANGETGVSLNKKIAIVFSEDMSPATINAANYSLKETVSGNNVMGTVTFVDRTATFTPTVPLLVNTTYTAMITTGVKNLAGVAMTSNYTWSFTTGEAADITAPSVTVTSPTNTSIDVPINRIINVSFSEAMDPLTINTSTFILKQGITPIPGVVTSIGSTATFTTSGKIANSALYTCTITTGARDLAGNALASDFIFTFTTGAIDDIIAPTVSVTSPTNTQTGIPVNRIINVGFSETMNPLTITTTTFTIKQGTMPVSGTVTSVGTTATFTPSVNLANGVLYTGTITTGVRDLAGNALASNFEFSFTTIAPSTDIIPPVASFTAPSNAATDVAVNRTANIAFSEAIDPSTINTTTFTLKQGTTSVPGVVTYAGLTAVFTPSANLSNSTLYTAAVTTGVRDLAGNALTSNYTWTFTTGAVTDAIAPGVSLTSPTDNALDVPVNRIVNAGFSEPMNPLTITAATFTLKQGSTPVSGTVTYIGMTAAFTPSMALANNTTYTAAITTGVRDLAGNAMASNFEFSFTTGAITDIIAPVVSVVSPTDKAIDVPINRIINIGFNEAMDPLTITTATYSLKETISGINVPGIVVAVSTSASYTPAVNLSVSTDYTITITTQAKDLAGNALAANFSSSFRTGPFTDVTAPVVASTNPASGGYASVYNKITATFNEDMDAATINTATFTVTKADGTPVSGAVTHSGPTATFTRTGGFAYYTTYTATITTGARDLANNSLAANHSWSFSTGAPPDTTPPTINSVDPINGATGVAINKTIAATFSESMNSSTITTAAFSMKETVSGINVPLTFTSLTGNTANFTPAAVLTNNTAYTFTISTLVQDSPGNSMASNYIWGFTTIIAADVIPPTVLVVYPADGAQNIGVKEAITATFDEELDPLSITTLTFTIQKGADPALAGSVVYNAVGSKATLTPTQDLLESTTYSLTLTTGVKDLAGNALALPKTWTFKTGQAAPALGNAKTFALMSRGAITGGGNTIHGPVGNTVAQGIPVIEIDGGSSNPSSIHINDATFTGAQADLLIAYNQAEGKTGFITLDTGELGSRVLAPGVYKSPAASFGLNNVLTLDAQGNPNAVFIFQMSTTLITNGYKVNLINGAKADNVYWQVGSAATIQGGTEFYGNLMAHDDITVAGSTIVGRILAGSSAAGNLTFNASTITLPTP